MHVDKQTAQFHDFNCAVADWAVGAARTSELLDKLTSANAEVSQVHQ